MLRNMKIGFIGGGNMATAMAMRLKRKVEKILVSDKDEKQLKKMASRGIATTEDNFEVISQSDIIILAVKPNIYSVVLKEIGKSNKIFISLAPGISIAYLKSYLGDQAKIVRAMPNTPALIGKGMTVTCFAPPMKENEYQLCNQVFEAVGSVISLPENLMNGVVAVNGSSPAYVYMMIEAMADAAVRNGIPRQVAYPLAAQSVVGAAEMVLQTGTHPGALKDAVCSPGGTTIEAVYTLEQCGFRAALMEAMQTCTEKAEELGAKYSS